jgi:adenine-specific DNA-methyltransferase
VPPPARPLLAEPRVPQLRWPGDDQAILLDADGAIAFVPAGGWPELLEGELTVEERVGDGEDAGLLVHGDVLAAATAVEPRSVKLAYLDPPFNTQERFADFADALSADVWLSMMRDRLAAVWGTLRPDGSLWVHCDDHQQAHLRVLMDQLFGPQRYVATIVWQRRYSRENRRAIGTVHDSIHVYAPLGARWREVRNRLPRRDPEGTWRNPDRDPRGPWTTTSLVAQGGHGTPSQFYAITTPAGNVVEPPPGSCWRVTRERFDELRREGRISFGAGGGNVPRRKVYLSDAQGLVPWSWWPYEEVGHNQEARKEVAALFPDRPPFATPKPERLMARILEIATRPGDLVLDGYLGSGTTAAVAHRLGRRWIGVELRRDVIDRFALPRLRRVLDGTAPSGVEATAEWAGGGSFAVARAPGWALDGRRLRDAA